MSVEREIQKEQTWRFPEHPGSHPGVTLRSLVDDQTAEFTADQMSRVHEAFVRTAITILEGRRREDLLQGFRIQKTGQGAGTEEYRFIHINPADISQSLVEGKVRVNIGDHIESSEVILHEASRIQ